MLGIGGCRLAQGRTACRSWRHIAIGVMSVTFMITCALSAVAFDVAITADEIVGTNTTYDNQSILIDGATVTLDGLHTFSNLHLTNGAKLTHSYADANAEYSLALTVSGLLSICSNSMIEVTGRGYRGGYSYGNTTNSAAAGGAGGSYGGLGGWDSGRADSVPNSVYGDFRTPNELGSGGAYLNAGGSGGGLIRLTAAALILDGQLIANGGVAAYWDGGGGGSGGGIYVNAGTLSGVGSISASGGAGSWWISGGGGGGGRIAIFYDQLDGFDVTNQVSCVPASGKYGLGSPGTVYMKQTSRPGLLRILNEDVPGARHTPLWLPEGERYADDIELSGANLAVELWSDALTASNLSILNGAVLTHRATTSSEAHALVMAIAGTLHVASDSAIDVTGRGYRGGYTYGNTRSGASTGTAGGSYGGTGGHSVECTPNGTYGDPTNPNEPGSGGGTSGSPGAAGGGVIRVTAQTLILDGELLAGGQSGKYANPAAGGGSGGSIYLDLNTIRGPGCISASGGDGGVWWANGPGGGGGGGRIAVYYETLDGFDVDNISAAGASGDLGSGQAGTVYVANQLAPLCVLSIDPFPAVSEPVSSIIVEFGSPLNTSTLDLDDFCLTESGESIGLSSIAQVGFCSYEIALSATLENDGAYTLRAGPNISTMLGAPMEAVYTNTFQIDTVPPNVPQLTEPSTPLGTTNLSSHSIADIRGHRDDNCTVWLNGNLAVPIGSGAWSADASLAEGLNAVPCFAEDVAGNRSPTNIILFMVDSVAPAITESRPADGIFTNTPPVAIELAYVEATSGLDLGHSFRQVLRNGISVPGNWSMDTSSIVFTPSGELIDGFYDVSFTPVDLFGNEGSAWVSDFALDRTPPAMPTVSPVTSPTTIGSQMVSGTKDAGADVYRDGAKVSAEGAGTIWSTSVSLSAGLNNLAFFSRDTAGNDSAVTNVTIVYDNVCPGVITGLVADVEGHGVEITLAWTNYDEFANGDDIGAYITYGNESNFTHVSEANAIATNVAGVQSLTVTGLVRGVTNYYAVMPVDTTGQAHSNVLALAVAPVDVAPPPDPTALRFECGNTNLLLSWDHSVVPDSDLAGYRIYLDGTCIADLASSENQWLQVGLEPAADYTFTVNAYDDSGNEGNGSVAIGYTLLANPANVSVQPYSGMATLTWDPVAPAGNVSHYLVYSALSNFTTVAAMSGNVESMTSSASVAGLEDGTSYYFAVTAVNKSGGETKDVATVMAQPQPDTTGPQLGGLLWNEAAVNSPAIAPGSLSIPAEDPAGMSRVEFYVEGVLLKSLVSEGAQHTCFWDVSGTDRDGPHAISVRAYDTLDNVSVLNTNINVQLAVPPSPTITSPLDGARVNDATLTVSGSVDAYADTVTCYVDGVAVQHDVSVSGNGTFSGNMPLQEGTNAIQIAAVNRAGEGVRSPIVNVVLDTSVPDTPRAVAAAAREAGIVRVSWRAPFGVDVQKFRLYRSSNPFTTRTEALWSNDVAAVTYRDVPDEGTNYYRVAVINTAGTESDLSAQVSAVADATLPRALSIAFDSDGDWSPGDLRFAAGTVDVTVTVSEELLAAPFLSFASGQGAPLVVDLRKQNETVYKGAFEITASTPSATAYANFSARDRVGNQGTDVDSGNAIIVDNRGPEVSHLAITPESPVLNDDANPTSITVVIGFDVNDVPDAVPQLFYRFSHSHPEPQALSLAPQSSSSWYSVLTLPADAGQSGAETLSFTYCGVDDLGNTGVTINAESSFQVYQGDLPPLDPPADLVAHVLPEGRVSLAWSAVLQASGYSVYHKGPGQGSFSNLVTTEQTTHEHAASDGTNYYALATLRAANGVTVTGSQCAAVAVVADSISPSAPSNLSLKLYATGMSLDWQAPADVDTLNFALYRSPDPITTNSILNLVPIQADLLATNALDSSPLQGLVYYAVTASDPAGNESGPSVSVSTNLSLLPVNSLHIVHDGTDPPVISWTHSASSHIDGYNVYTGPSGQEVQLNSTVISPVINEITDPGYRGDSRRYTVTAVDDGQQTESLSRSLVLPELTATLAAEAVLNRGVMNGLDYRVVNTGEADASNIWLVVSAAGRTHRSASFDVNAGATGEVHLVVGGYADLEVLTTLTNTITLTPAVTESVRIIGRDTIEVGEDLLTAEILNESFIRGGCGQARFVLHNTCSETIDVVLARQSGGQPSDEISFRLEDHDGSVFSIAFAQQSLGDAGQVLRLSDGTDVARIEPGKSFTSAPVEIAVPTNAPDQAAIRLSIDNIYHAYSYDNQIAIRGLACTRDISLVDTPYYAEATNVSPSVSSGGEPILISGHVVERGSAQVMGDVPLSLTISLNGFERTHELYSNDDGQWSYEFVPQPGESGLYRVWATHPDIEDKPDQETFTITRVGITPLQITASLPTNYERRGVVSVSTSEGLSLTNLHLAYDAAEQPGGILPQGVHVDVSEATVPLLGPGETADLPFVLWGDNMATNAAEFRLRIDSDGAPGGSWGTSVVSYAFFAATPSVFLSPSLLETGVTLGDTVSEVLVLENVGFATLEGVSVDLVSGNGNPVPSWISLNGSLRGDLESGSKRDLSLSIAPTNGVAVGAYDLQLVVTADNHDAHDVEIHVVVDATGRGGVIFKIEDVFSYQTQTNGFSEATICLEKQDGFILVTNGMADVAGEVLFQDLPAGRYKYHASSPGYQSKNGIIWVKPGTVQSESVFLEFDMVTFEWRVTPTDIEDRYDIVLDAVYETRVPAPVLTVSPASVPLPEMDSGDVFTGEFVLRNEGPVRADAFVAVIPEADEFYRCEIMTDPPAALGPGEYVRVPYRITCVNPPEAGEAGVCQIYTLSYTFSASFTCANGEVLSASTSGKLTRAVGDCAGIGNLDGLDASGSGTVSLGDPSIWAELRAQAQGLFAKFMADFLSTIGPLCAPKPDRCEEDNPCPCVERFETVQSYVDLTTGQYGDSIVDLSAKVLGGRVGWTRSLQRSREWIFNEDWSALELEYDVDNALETVLKNGLAYERSGSDGKVFRRGDDHRILVTEDGYRWEGRRDNWREYDAGGTMLRYSDHHGITVNLMYEDDTLVGVQDHFSNQVFWIAYDEDSRVSSVSSLVANVQYSYSPTGQLTNVTDALGYNHSYEYYTNGLISNVYKAGGEQVCITYNTDGYVSGVADSNAVGKTFEYGYDAAKSEYYALVEDAQGRVTEKWYDSDGKLTKTAVDGDLVAAAEPAPYAPEYTYDAYGNITRIAHVDGSTMTRVFTHAGEWLSREVDALGVVTTYGYNDSGDLTNRVEAAGTNHERITTYCYDAYGQLSAMVLFDGSAPQEPVRATAFAYDEFGNVTSVSNAQSVTTYTYDAFGNVTTVVNSLGLCISNSYDVVGNLLSAAVLDASAPVDLLRMERYAYDAGGNLTCASNAHAQVFYTYDRKGRLQSISNSLHRLIEYERDLDGHIVRQDTRDNGILIESLTSRYSDKGQITSQSVTRDGPPLTVDFEYDDDGRLISLRETYDGQARTNSYQYDAESGYLVSSDDALFSQDYGYDIRGRLVSTTLRYVVPPDDPAQPHFVQSLSYDRGGRILSRTDPMGRATSSTYDAFGRMTTVVDAMSHTNRFKYDSTGSLSYLIDANGHETGWQYDDAGRLTRKTYADDSCYTYGYDALGQLTQSIDANGQVAEYRYDILGLLTNITTRPSAQAAVERFHAYAYDPQGRLTHVTEPAATFSLEYDDTNRTARVTADYGSGRVFTCAYQYDAYRRLIRMIAGNSGSQAVSTNTYTYDGRGRIVGVSIPGQGTAAYRYDSEGALAGVRLPGGNVTTFTRDNFGSMVTNTAFDPAGNGILRESYDRDILGKIVARETDSADHTYAYDAVDRLTNAILDSVTGGPSEEYAYSYDRMGNRITVTESGTSVTSVADYLSNELNQYMSVSSVLSVVGFQYDANGSLTNDGVRVYTWDSENRLTLVEPLTPIDGSEKTEFQYDYMGRRISKTTAVYSIADWSTMQTNHFFYDGWNMVMEVRSRSEVVTTNLYTWGLDFSGTLQGAGGIGGLLSMRQSTSLSPLSKTYYYCYDHNGNIIKMITPSGATVAEYEYDPYGQITKQSGPMAEDNPFRFSTKYHDDETGLVYYGYRYYDPQLGRWLRRDPIGEQGGLNLYAFVNNQPANLVDPLGLAIYAFDGTWEHRADHLSNIGFLSQRYSREQGRPFYEGGVGNSTEYGAAMQSLGGVSGAGASAKLEKMYDELVKAYNKGDQNIDIIGFSRGGAMAVEFANMVAERGVPKLCTAYEYSRRVYRGNSWITKTETRYRENWEAPRIRFVGLYDVVGSFGIPGNRLNLGKRRRLPSAIPVTKAVHVISENEHRSLFPYTDVTPKDTSLYGSFVQVSGRGDHSNIGGGHGGNSLNDPERSLSNFYLNWMIEQANSIPDEGMLFRPLGAPSDLSVAPHDLTSDPKYKLLPNRPRNLSDLIKTITP